MSGNLSVFDGRRRLNRAEVFDRIGVSGKPGATGRNTRPISSGDSKMSRQVTVLSGREQRTKFYDPSTPPKVQYSPPETIVQNKTPIWVWIVLAILIILLIVFIILWLVKGSGAKGGIGDACTAETDCATGLICSSGTCQATNCLLPAAPINLALTAVGNDQIDATWSSVSNATSYILFVSKTENFTIPDDIDGAVTATTNSGSISGLESGALYYAKVASVNSCGTGTASSEQSVQMPSFPNNVAIKINPTDRPDMNLEVNGSNVRAHMFTTDLYGQWIFNQVTKELKSVDDTTKCLTVNGLNAETALCSGLSATDKEWDFSNDGHICLSSDTAEKCLYLLSPLANTSDVGVGNVSGATTWTAEICTNPPAPILDNVTPLTSNGFTFEVGAPVKGGIYTLYVSATSPVDINTASYLIANIETDATYSLPGVLTSLTPPLASGPGTYYFVLVYTNACGDSAVSNEVTVIFP